MPYVVPIEEIYDIVFPDSGVNGYLAMLYVCYLDDSKDQHEKRAVVSGGFIGNKNDWQELRLRWKRCLRKHGLDYFKTSEWRGLRDQFQNFRDRIKYPEPKGRGAADKIREELERIIDEVDIIGVANAIPVQTYMEVAALPETRGMFNCKPYRFAFEGLLYETVKIVREFPGVDNRVAFVHDSGDDFKVLYDYYELFKKWNVDVSPYMETFIPLDDKKQPPLQVADLMANIAKNYTEQWLEKPSTENLKNLRDSIQRMTLFTKEFMLDLATARPWTPGEENEKQDGIRQV
jgi:hypothetical protein